MTMVKFIDISYYDPIVDWDMYNWDGTFIKVSEGTVRDPDFIAQWTAAKNKTIRGGYHFFRPSVDAISAAEKFVSYFRNDLGELPPVLDLEVTDGMVSGIPEKAERWLNRVRFLTGLKPIIYTSEGFINRVKLGNYSQFGEYKLWLAAYPRDEITATWTETMRRHWISEVLERDIYIFPLAPKPFKYVTFVQWTGKCPPEYVPGYPVGTKLAVDINFYHSDLRTLYNEFDIKVVLTKEGEPYMDTIVTMTADLKSLQPSNLRPNPGLQAGLIRTLVGPLHIECVGQKVFKDNYWWSEVIHVGGEDEHGWIAWTTSYENVQVITPTTQKKIVKSVLFFDDGTSQELFPTP